MTSPQAAVGGHVLYVRRIPEHPVAGKRLGRHVRRDSRSLRYPYRAKMGRALSDQLWPLHIPILYQGDVGSCTGDEEVGVLGTDPFFSVLPPSIRSQLNQAYAYGIYSDAEMIDGDGPYPPNDNGSTGPSTAQVALNRKLISGYLHVTNVSDMVDALQDGPVGIGINWYSSFDHPDSNGGVSIAPSAYVRGGHEVEVRGVKVADQLFLADNSWSPAWGVGGSFEFSWGTMQRLFGEQGDCTKCIPLSAPPPTPEPVPTDPDNLLWYGGPGEYEYGGAQEWTRHTHTGANRALKHDLQTWAHVKGFL